MSFGIKNCLFCEKQIILTIRRDIDRKRFCSHSCRQKFMIKTDARYLDNFYNGKQFCHTKEANLKKGHKLNNHPKWKTDRSLLKNRDRAGNKQWIKSVFERDNYTCVLCNKRGGKLQADHIKPYCAYPDLRTSLDNGRTLCESCHKKTDTYGAKAIKYKKGINYAICE